MLWLLLSTLFFAGFIHRASTLPISSASEPDKSVPADPLLITRGLYVASVCAFFLWALPSAHVGATAVAASPLNDASDNWSVSPGAFQDHSVVSIGESQFSITLWYSCRVTHNVAPSMVVGCCS
jgi:hypothetical protein